MAQTTFGQLQEEAAKLPGYAPHPEGIFTMKVSNTEVKRGSNGQSQILARMETVDPGPDQGKTLLNNMSPRKNDGDPNPVFFRMLGALGFGPDNPALAQAANMDEDQAVAFLAGQILGAQAVVEVTHREWQNVARDNVKNMFPVGTKVATGRKNSGPVVAGAPAVAGVPTVPTPPLPPAPAQSVAPAPPVQPQAVQPVAPAPAPTPAPVAVVQAAPVAPVPAQEATPAPTTVQDVVAQFPQQQAAPQPQPEVQAAPPVPQVQPPAAAIPPPPGEPF